MKKSIVSIAVGSAFIASAALAPVANAAENPFTGVKLSSGYQVADASMPAADKKKDGKCSEAKCSATKKKTTKKTEKKADANCSAEKKAEGKCSADKKKEAHCSAEKKADGKCSADKK